MDVVPYMQKDIYTSDVMRESFVESLIWRNPKAFSSDNKNIVKIINRNIVKTEY
jgi:hypothetical protein